MEIEGILRSSTLEIHRTYRDSLVEEGCAAPCCRTLLLNPSTTQAHPPGVPKPLYDCFERKAQMDTEFIIGEIDAEIARLQTARTILAQAVTASAAPTPVSKPSRRLSKVARERIAAAQRKRWAAAKKASTLTPAKAEKKSAPTARKRRLSAEAKKRIAEAQRKRWAAIKATKKAVKAAPAKNVAKKAPVVKAKKVAPKKAAAKKAPPAKAKKAAPEKAAPAPTEAATS